MAQLTLQPSCLETSADVADSTSVRFVPTSPPAKNTSQGSSLGSRPLSWEAPPPTRDYEVRMWRDVSQSLSGGCLDEK